jgi:putative membrane protein
MKSLNPSLASLRRALLVTTFALTAGAGLAVAQSSGSTTGSTPGSTNTDDTNGRYNSASNTGSNETSSMSNSANTDNDISSSRSSSTSSGKKLSWSDRHFVTKAADGGMSEVQLGQLAAQKASNPDVRAFGQKLVQDHSVVNSELMSLANNKNVKIDKDETKDRTYRRLSKASGEDFDREFVEHAIDDHEKDIKMFEKAANDAKDPDVRNFASKHLADLREHLATAQRLQQSIAPTGRTDRESWKSQSSSSGTNTNSANDNINSSSSSSSSTPGSDSTQPTRDTNSSQSTTPSGGGR